VPIDHAGQVCCGHHLLIEGEPLGRFGSNRLECHAAYLRIRCLRTIRVEIDVSLTPHNMKTIGGVFVFILALLGLPSMHSAHVIAQAAQDSEVVLVDGPGRVLASAVQQFGKRCHCIVTYEDIRWRQDQVQDAPGFKPRRPDLPMLRIPKGIPFTFTISRQVESQTPAQIAQSLRELLAAYEGSNNVGSFRLVEDNGSFHIIPATNAVFDVPVTLAEEDWSLTDVVNAISTSVNRVTGESMGLGGIASNFLTQSSVRVGGQSEQAGALLSRALAATGRKQSWFLLYDFGMKQYILNIHFVQ
jgi:hypothetical protein